MNHPIITVLAECIRDGDYREIASRLEDYKGPYAALYLMQACNNTLKKHEYVAERLAAELKKRDGR